MKTLYTVIFIMLISACKTTNGNNKKGSLKEIDSVKIVNLKDAERIEYWNDNTENPDSIYIYKNNVLTSRGYVYNNTITFLDINNNIEKQGGMKNGKLDGIVTIFNKNKPLATFQYIKGKKDGLSVYFNDSLRVVRLVNYKNDKPYGLFVKIGSDGQINQIKTLMNLDSLNQNPKFSFYNNGKVHSISARLNGGTDGWGYYFDKSNVLYQKILYNQGSIEKSVVTDSIAYNKVKKTRSPKSKSD
jgi:antitoxin component YwqK of YwqJK toxin-antitoxin module